MVAAFFIVQKKECQLAAYDDLQIFHVVAGICGVVVFVASFVNIAGMLHEIKILFLAVSQKKDDIRYVYLLLNVGHILGCLGHLRNWLRHVLRHIFGLREPLCINSLGHHPSFQGHSE